MAIRVFTKGFFYRNTFISQSGRWFQGSHLFFCWQPHLWYLYQVSPNCFLIPASLYRETFFIAANFIFNEDLSSLFFCLFILAHMYRSAYVLIGWEAHVWEFQRSTLGIFHQIVSFHILFWGRISLGLELIYWVLLANQWQICLSAFLALELQPNTL